MEEMVATKNDLCELGLDGWISEDYEKLVRGEKPELRKKLTDGEHAQVKIDNDYHTYNFKNIKDSDAVLVVNESKNGQDNYIGGNTLMEMGQAYVLGKEVFILYDIPSSVPYVDEIKSLEPVCLHGKLSDIKKFT